MEVKAAAAREGQYPPRLMKQRRKTLKDHANELKAKVSRDHFVAFCKSFSSFMFSTVGLCLLVFLYSIAGGVLFSYLELESEETNLKAIQTEAQAYQDGVLQRMGTTCLEIDCSNNESHWRAAMQEILQEIQIQTHEMTKNGWDGTFPGEETKPQWEMVNSLLFAITIITTIGYGHIAPKTPVGMMCTVGYSILGVPIALLYLANMGSFMADLFRYVYHRLCCDKCCPARCARRGISQHNLAKPAGLYQKPGREAGGLKPNAPLRRDHSHTMTRDPSRTLSPEASHSLVKDTSNTSATSDVSEASIENAQNNAIPHTNNSNADEETAADKLSRRRDMAHVWTLYQSNIGSIKYPTTDASNISVRSTAIPNTAKHCEGGERHVSFTLTKNESNTGSHTPFVNTQNSAISNTNNSNADEETIAVNILSGQQPDKIEEEKKLSLSELKQQYVDWKSKYRYMSVPVSLTILVMVSYLFIGALIFSVWENWTFVQAFYFSFITLTTIGLGDLVPGLKETGSLKPVLCAIYVLLGLALIAMCMDLMQAEVKTRVVALAQKIGIIQKPEDKLKKTDAEAVFAAIQA